MKKIHRIRERCFELLESEANHDNARKAIIYFLFILISLNVLMVVLETEQGLYEQYIFFFFLFEIISIIIFSIEYMLRLWVCTFNPDYSAPISGRLRYALSPLALIDLLAILPFFIPFVIPLDLRILRMVRLTRVFRVLKLGRFSHAWETFSVVLRSRAEELIVSIIIIFMILTISSSVMYFVEHDAQPDKFSSIPAAMWWGVVTLSTVGYGDIYPITQTGKLIGAIVAISGIALFALPAGIIVAGFVENVHIRNHNSNGSLYDSQKSSEIQEYEKRKESKD